MRKINYIVVLTFASIFGLVNACQDEFLEVSPQGQLSGEVLATADGVDALLIGAYAMLSGSSGTGFGWQAAASGWVYSSIRAGEANKGTDSGDQPDINPIQNFTETASNPYLNDKWRSLYESISRTNQVIVVADEALASGAITDAEHTLFINQARALRGHFHFEAWRMWEMVPYLDETMDPNEVTNSADIGPMIIADLQAGTNLPNDMGQIGRFNGTVSRAILGKALMDLNGDYAGALTQFTQVLSGTKPDGSAIGLAPTFGEIFDAENRNGIEAIYTLQYSVNDGSGGWNGGWGEALNFPYKAGASPGGCCGFYQPSFDWVNSFRTSGGLPLLDDSYNADPVLNDQGILPSDPFTEDAGELDPRLDWSVGRRGIPYLDWGDHTGQDWIRDQTYAGPYSPKKQVYRLAQEGAGLTEVGNWTSGFTANGYRMIRAADVILLQAECMIETGDLAGALANINTIRNRAANPAGFVMEADGVTPAANYVINPYTSFANADEARTALRMERKLELGMEGHRFWDLKRWGIAQTEINRFLSNDAAILTSAYSSGVTFGPEDVTYPIPQRQIDLSVGNLVQNR